MFFRFNGGYYILTVGFFLSTKYFIRKAEQPCTKRKAQRVVQAKLQPSLTQINIRKKAHVTVGLSYNL